MPCVIERAFSRAQAGKGRGKQLTCHPQCSTVSVMPQSDVPRVPVPAVYELDGTGRDGVLKNFEKPWAMTTGTHMLF